MHLPQKKRFMPTAELKWWGHERGTGAFAPGNLPKPTLRGATASPKEDDIAFEAADDEIAFEAEA